MTLIEGWNDIYRMNDDPKAAKAAILVGTLDEAHDFNRRGWGIFATLQRFDGAPRRIENLVGISAWAVDIDEGTKEEQAERIMSAPLLPSRVVETKKGYHVHWTARNGSAERYNAIVLDRLVPYFNADRNARDIARILRVPGFFHMKDPTDPFLIKQVFTHKSEYTEEQMARYFPLPEAIVKEREHVHEARRQHTVSGDDDFWNRAFSLDCEYALERLSGHSCVSGEKYTFGKDRNGKRNIFVDGKSTSCWIDSRGRVASHSGIPPAIFGWLRWYKLSYKEIYQVLIEVFPELKKEKR